MATLSPQQPGLPGPYRVEATATGGRVRSVMKVAVVHSFYASGQPSGENEAVLDQVRALRRAGHEVRLFAAHTDELVQAPLYAPRAAARVATGRGRHPLAGLRAYDPDIVHVHNLFPNFGRVWLRGWDGPLVATMHNYRPMCAAATLYREGQVCTRCLDGERWASLRHGCYRSSRTATLPLAWAGRRGAASDPLLARADRLVVLSSLAERTYRRAGVPAECLRLVPNFVGDPSVDEAAPGDNGRWLAVARLTAEKGILELLRRWPAEEPLDIVGDGELMAECRAAAPPSVRFLRSLDRSELRRRLPSWRGLVFSSRVFEGAVPLVYIESLAAGLPVIAFEGSSAAESVKELGTGLVMTWQEPLAPVLREGSVTFPGLRERCRQSYADHFTEQGWSRRMNALYAELVSETSHAQDSDRPADSGTPAAGPVADGTGTSNRRSAFLGVHGRGAAS
ncbi:glycosyltransferase family 4 protein [Streptomyces sp. NPDC050287]|uniref:glycosyltransferase family 4 protein n=1 Tax=Streptomyces sp. NPDC050287 TaxID=3365608 RepID=UPI00379B69DA